MMIFAMVNLQNWLEPLSHHSDDIIFFYYTGHGARDPITHRPWPMLCLHDGIFPGAVVTRYLCRGQHRFVFVVLDACNNVLCPPTRWHVRPKELRKMLLNNVEGLTSLFLNPRGNVIVAAAQPDEAAFTNAFTQCFFYALENAFNTKDFTWQSIFETTYQECLGPWGYSWWVWPIRQHICFHIEDQNGVYDFPATTLNSERE